MSGLVALCADATSLQHPEALGLSGECVTAQDWLLVFSSAEEARRRLRADRMVDEVWVASSDEVEPINLAATLKSDRPDRCVCLLTFQGTGSLWSRASAAGIDASLTRQAFVARYGQRKRLAADEASRRVQREALRQDGMESRRRAMDSLEDAAPAGAGGASADARALARERRQAAPAATDEPPAPAWRIPSQQDAPAQAAAPAQPVAPAQAQAAPTRLEVPAPQPRSAQLSGSAFLLPVLGGGGGVGKSTVAALCALLSQRRGQRTLLLDFDLQFGDMPRLLGVEAPLCVDEALAAPARLDQLEPSGGLPALLAAPARLELSEVVAEQAPELLDALSGRFDVIVANTGASWAEQHAVLLERCSKALFLVDQRPSSIEACQRALDLCQRCGIAAGPFSFAVNRTSKRSLFTSIDVACALNVQQVFELADGGRDVEELLGAGMPLELLDSRNALCESVDEMLCRLLPDAGGEDAREAGRDDRGGLFGRRRGRRERRGREGGAS